MKRVLAVAVLGVGLALPAQALGAVNYTGKVKGEPGSGIEFETRKTSGTKIVRNFTAVGIPMTCEGGPGAYGFGDNTKPKIHADRSFKIIRDFGPETTVRVHGQFAAGFAKATGTVKVKTESMTLGQCHSAKLEWKAEKQT